MSDMEDIQTHWATLPTADSDQLVDTAGMDAIDHYNAGGYAFHEAFYDLNISEGHLGEVATFVRAGLPPQLQFGLNADFLYYVNWSSVPDEAGPADIHVGEDGRPRDRGTDEMKEILSHLGRATTPTRLLEAVEDEPYYVPEALYQDRTGWHYRLPLNVDVALRLMRTNQEKFKSLFEALLMAPDRRELARRYGTLGWDDEILSFIRAARQLSEEMDGLMGFEFGHGVEQGEFKLKLDFRVTHVLQYVPNSVTWAWARLLDAVARNASYGRCAHARCNRLFEKSRPDQKYCSAACGDAHRHHRLRSGGHTAGPDGTL